MCALLFGLSINLLVGAPAQALSGASAVPEGSWGFVAKVDVGGVRACTGALVNPQWVLTASSCFAVDGQAPTAGAPTLATTVTLGRTNLSSAAGRRLPAVEILPHPDRGVVLVKLSVRVLDIAPIAIGGTAPAVGDAFQVLGYGRTATEWVPDRLQAAGVAVDSVATGAFTWIGQGSSQVSACKGDAGGPVFRDNGGQPQLVGLDVAAWQAGCLGESETGYGATAARVDDLASWISRNTPGLTTAFKAFFASGAGIGTYDLASPQDQAVPFDYNHSGKLDHLITYRPGTGIVYILERRANNSFAPVYSSRTGIGSYDLASTLDRIVPFDYDHSGKLDHLLLYRPGSHIVYIVKHAADGSFTPVFASHSGIGGYDLAQPADQVIAFDYDHSGKLDHLVLYRPGWQTIYILKHEAGNTFTRVYASTTGIGGYDLAQPADRIVALDYEHVAAPDYLLLYRPGHGPAWVVGRVPQTPSAAPVAARVGAVTSAGDSAAEQADAPSSIVEDYTHPDADGILAQHQLKVFKGDGHIMFDSAKSYAEGSECTPGLLQIEKSLDVEPYGMFYCFRTIGTKGFLTLEVPGTFGVRGGSAAITATAELPDGTVLPPYEVDPNERVAIEPGTGSEPPQAILVELRMD